MQRQNKTALMQDRTTIQFAGEIAFVLEVGTQVIVV